MQQDKNCYMENIKWGFHHDQKIWNTTGRNTLTYVEQGQKLAATPQNWEHPQASNDLTGFQHLVQKRYNDNDTILHLK